MTKNQEYYFLKEQLGRALVEVTILKESQRALLQATYDGLAGITGDQHREIEKYLKEE